MVKYWELLLKEPKQIPKGKKRPRQPKPSNPPSHLPKPSNPSPQLPKPADPMSSLIPSQLPQPLPSLDLEFTTFVHTSGLVIPIGSIYFLESLDIPFVVSRIFRSNLQTMASCFRRVLSSDRKITGFSEDCSCTTNLSYFVRIHRKGEFSFPFFQCIKIIQLLQNKVV